MDRNFLTFMAVSMLILVVWQGFLAPEPPVRPSAEEPAPVAEPVDRAAPGAGSLPGSSGVTSDSPIETEPSEVVAESPAERISIRMALWDAVFSSRGGGLESFKLRDYVDRELADEPPIEMATVGPEWDLALATPLKGLGLGNLSKLDYEVSQPGMNTLVFERSLRGIVVRKTYLFEEDSYLFRLRIEVENGTDRPLTPNFNTIWPARAGSGADFLEFNLAAYSDGDTHTFMIVPMAAMMFGGSAMDQEDADELNAKLGSNIEWAGAHSRYFIAALVPDNPREAVANFKSLEEDKEALLQLAFTSAEIPPGGRLDREFKVYLGPKEPERLDPIGAHLDEAILKGWFPALSRFFTWLIQAVYDFVPNYGVAIIVITILVRVLMAPLMVRQMKSMKRISAMQPEIKEVQAKHPDDRQKQSEAMMAVYKRHGLSPFSMFSGCLPMILQLPVFIGFYYALQGSILLRQQPFIGWMTDLSQPEALFTLPGVDLPVRVLPLLMGGSMFLQQKLSPQTAMDPAQARMMLWMMPIMFTVLFYQFASGLVLYWFVSTLIGIGQQWLTNRSKD